MNGSTDVRSDNTTPQAAEMSASAGKTDTPLPIGRGVSEVGDTSSGTSSSSGARAAQNGDRMISGIDLIDYGAGGLIPNHVYLVKGGSGVGKTILGLQFLARGLEHQEPGVMITDQKPESIIAQAKAVGFPIEEAVKRNQLSILNPSTRYFDLVESPADVMAIVEELGDYVKRIGAKRLVIDPVYTLINTQYSSHFALTLTQSLLNALEDLPTTILLIAGDEDNAEMNPIIRMLEQNASGVLHLQQDTATGGRLMRINKLRYSNADNLSAHYRILNGRGLINYRGGDEKVTDVTQPWEDTATASRKVLILGAQPDTIRRVKETLGDKYEVDAESDLRAGVDRAKREKPGLVLLTPQRSAGSVGAILELSQGGSSSLAFLSPSANRQSDKVLYLRAGADDFITEPFTPAEFKARVDALIRRSGRRLDTRDSGMSDISADEMSSLMTAGETSSSAKTGPVLTATGDSVQFEPAFKERIQRNIDTVSKFDTPFALYWIKADGDDRELNTNLAKLCRQEDILCHNRGGEFVAILTGTDANGVKGFENRLDEKLGRNLQRAKRGYQLYRPGEEAKV